MKSAYELYDEMLNCYWQSEHSEENYRKFMLAAIALAKLNEPNPFRDEELHVNAAAKPGCGPRVVTSVIQ